VNKITIDSERGILLADNGLNLYDNFNYIFPRLVRGDNLIHVEGICTVTYHCEFPIGVSA
jgi:phage-related protein